MDLMDEEPSDDAQVKKSKAAVAITYDKEEDSAPRIVASGKGEIAEQILAVAFEHGVKVREDAALVDILSKLEVDSLIPLEAYAAVAEILSYVYRANQGARKPLP